MLVKLYNENPNIKQIRELVSFLEKGEIMIIPTDSVYAFACSLNSPKSAEKMARLKGIKPEKAKFSIICNDLSSLSEYTTPISTNTYKIMRKNLPGAFTFILKANNKIPKLFQSKRKAIGIRVPENNITREIVNELGCPLIVTSVKKDDEFMEYYVDPELIHEQYHKQINIVVDGGIGQLEPTTVIDCSEGGIDIIREGRGILE